MASLLRVKENYVFPDCDNVMNKWITLALAICWSLFLGSCSASVEKRNDGTLFEVINNGSTTNYPPGETLVLRVSGNGQTEYDSFPSLNSSVRPFPFQVERKSANIDLAQVDEFRSLLEEIDSDKVSFYGPQTSRSVDSYVTVTLNYTLEGGPRQVRMEENDTHIHLNSLASPSLRKFMSLIYEIRVHHERRSAQ